MLLLLWMLFLSVTGPPVTPLDEFKDLERFETRSSCTIKFLLLLPSLVASLFSMSERAQMLPSDYFNNGVRLFSIVADHKRRTRIHDAMTEKKIFPRVLFSIPLSGMGHK